MNREHAPSAGFTRDVILLVEDEPDTRTVLFQGLTSAGLTVIETDSASDAARLARDQRPAAVVMDWRLREGDGLSAVAQIRLFSRVPILMLSGRDKIDDKVLALTTGADDYLSKPFAIEELVARVRALLRRRGGEGNEAPMRLVFEDIGLVIDRANRHVSVRGLEIGLTPKEYDLLCYLAANVDVVIGRQAIKDALFSDGSITRANAAIDTQISRLRKKLEADPNAPQMIVTVHRVGYKLASRQG